jgi:hypothetical protein
VTKPMVVLCVLAAALAVEAANAKDICVSAGEPVFWRFAKVKPLKKAGAVAPLNGYFFDSKTLIPVTGTAVKRSDGLVVVGVYVHSQDPLFDIDAAGVLLVDAAFTGTGKLRNDGETASTDLTWTGTDCRNVPVP